MNQTTKRLTIVFTLIVASSFVTGSYAKEEASLTVSTAQEIAQLEKDFSHCLKNIDKSEFLPGRYSASFSTPAYIYYSVLEEDKITLRKRFMNILGAASFSDTPPGTRDYPSIVFVDNGLDGNVDKREIVPGFVQMKTANSLLEKETFPKILEELLDACPK